MHQTDIPETMIAMVTTGHGGYEKLELRHKHPMPLLKEDEVLIKVSACGMNNTDINTRVGWYDDNVQSATNDSISQDGESGWGGVVTFPRIQGADICGKVVQVGSACSDTLMNKRVITDSWLRNWDDPLNRVFAGYTGSERDGGFAQFVAMPEKNVYAVETDWSDTELATISCSYSTAENMLVRARVKESETVLITGASGGVGSALIQLAKLRSCRVIALSTEDKANALLSLGADAIIRRGKDDWKAIIKNLTGTDTVDVVADVVGAPVFEKVLQVLKRGGRYVTAGAIGGKTVELDISHLYLKDWELIGSTVTTPDIFPNVVRYVEENMLKPLVAKTYPLAEIQIAQEEFLSKKHVGNIVLEIPQ